MANRRLDESELIEANVLLAEIRERLAAVSRGDAELLFAFRRKIAKELTYDERNKPMFRRKLKIQKRKEQKGACALCEQPLAQSHVVLDRLVASAGYVASNTRLLCETCDRRVQIDRGYA
jgi:UTP:GlnB (protein PII) uridylyltransferase